MSFERTLLSIAMESGEVYVEPEIGLPDEDEDLNDYSELMVSTADEIGRGAAAVEALESLAKKYEAAEVTQESLESYRADVMQVFKLTGVSAPVSMIVPSFEDIKEDKTGINTRVKDMGAKVWAWIQEQIAKLKKRFKILSIKIRARIALARRKRAKFKEEMSAAKGDVKAGSVPDWMLDGDKLSTTNVDKFISWLLQGPPGHVMRGLDVGGNAVSKDKRQEYFEHAPWQTLTGEVENKTRAKKVSNYTATREQISHVADALFKAGEEISGMIEDLSNAENMFKDIQKSSFANHSEGPPQEIVQKSREETALIIKVVSAQMAFATKTSMEVFALYDNIAKIREATPISTSEDDK